MNDCPRQNRGLTGEGFDFFRPLLLIPIFYCLGVIPIAKKSLHFNFSPVGVRSARYLI